MIPITAKKALFIFRRDLRLEDNLGLLTALEKSTVVVPIFIFDPRQINPVANDYFSPPAYDFMLASLRELDAALHARGSGLQIFSGDPAQLVHSLIVNDRIDAVYINKDYTPFARTRDKTIADVCVESAVTFTRHDDLTLAPIETIRTKEDKLYTVFTPFMKNAAGYEVPTPRKNNFSNYYSGKLKTPTSSLSDYTIDLGDRTLLLSGGRTEALTIMRNNQYLKDYKERRNLPADHGTSRLSAHHKFGTISIRESYQMAKNHSGAHCHFISELYWRDFYYYIAYHFPVVFKKSFLPWANEMEWINDEEQFKAWCLGKTGVPMVDAAMRELNKTGWMHNRSRMIVASYLTKNLLIHWQWGEKYFAQNLIDYDPAQNNGGWQWSASTGADPRPLRIFNPYTQATNYDPEAEYIKKWLPELSAVPDSTFTDGKTQDFSQFASDYPAPLVDQKDSFHRANAAYKKAKERYKQKQTEIT